MPVVGRGRIVVWEGASLWVLQSEQASAQLQHHSHHAIQITFQLEGSFAIGIENRSLTGQIVAICSDASHNFQANGAGAFLFIAPESLAGRTLVGEFFSDQSWAIVESEPLKALREELCECYRSGLAEADILRIGKRIIAALLTDDEPAMPDARVLAMIRYARETLEDTISLPSAAETINLSQSRARHLFVSQTGLPFKTYVLWLRLERAVELYAGGSSLTEAAHSAGFSDSAHFSRTFRRTFGLPATALRLR